MRLVERVRRALSGSISSYSVSPSRKKPGPRSASSARDGAILKSTVELGLLVVTAAQRLIYRWAKRVRKRPQVLKLWRKAFGEVERLPNREASLVARQASVRK